MHTHTDRYRKEEEEEEKGRETREIDNKVIAVELQDSSISNNSVYKQKEFYFTKFSLVQVCCLDAKTVLLQAIQFSISSKFECQNRSISNNLV